MFYPNKRFAFVIAITCLAASIGLAFFSFRQLDILDLFSSVVILSLLYILCLCLLAIIKNQTVEFIDKDKIIVGHFCKMVTVDGNDLSQVIKRRDGAISYRFHKIDFDCQITPRAYHQAEALQEHFDRLFKLTELDVEVIEED